MITVIASISVKEVYLDEFITLFKENIPNVLAEDGCIEYYPTIDLPTDIPPQKQDKKVVTIIEKWQSVEKLNMHLIAPHMQEYRKATDNMVEDVTIKILQNA